jgi:cysteinyl-tRNA synthetase
MPEKMLFASDYIKEDIKLIKRLEEKNYTYKTKDGIYFNVSKMSDYGILWGGKRVHDEDETRIAKNPEKKNQEDFALWKFNNKIGFPSPWGQGFPGWHIECSAMSMKFLGEQFDIHTGGIEHIPIHHTNEIAQSECATGKKPFVRFWLHNEWVLFDNKKMAKSDNNFLKLGSLIERKINPIAYRFWLLMANYGTKMNFNWEALQGAETALNRLYGLYKGLGKDIGSVNKQYQKKFQEYIEDDLNTPEALSLLWDLIKDKKISPANKKATILNFDKVLGLNFKNLKEEKIPKEIKKLAEEREQARKNKDFKKSDELRNKIEKLGYEIKDSSEDYKIEKI